MIETPERIWAFEPDIFDDVSVWQDKPSPNRDTIEYVRVDLYLQCLAYETQASEAYEKQKQAEAREEGRREGMEEAANIALNANLANGESRNLLYGDEARGFAMGISGAYEAIRAALRNGEGGE